MVEEWGVVKKFMRMRLAIRAVLLGAFAVVAFPLLDVALGGWPPEQPAASRVASGLRLLGGFVGLAIADTAVTFLMDLAEKGKQAAMARARRGLLRGVKWVVGLTIFFVLAGEVVVSFGEGAVGRGLIEMVVGMGVLVAFGLGLLGRSRRRMGSRGSKEAGEAQV